MLESFFNSVSGPQVCNFINKKLQHRCFAVNIAKFLRTIFYRTPLVIASVHSTITMLNFNHALENLRNMDDFNFTNFLSDREMGCSTEGASYCCFCKAISNNYFQKVLLVTFIRNYANLFQHFIFVHLIED